MRYLQVTVNKEAFKEEVLKPLKSKIVWSLKQLFPLTYRSHYEQGNKKMFSVFKMWLGKTYKHEAFCIGFVEPERQEIRVAARSEERKSRRRQ